MVNVFDRRFVLGNLGADYQQQTDYNWIIYCSSVEFPNQSQFNSTLYCALKHESAMQKASFPCFITRCPVSGVSLTSRNLTHHACCMFALQYTFSQINSQCFFLQGVAQRSYAVEDKYRYNPQDTEAQAVEKKFRKKLTYRCEGNQPQDSKVNLHVFLLNISMSPLLGSHFLERGRRMLYLICR